MGPSCVVVSSQVVEKLVGVRREQPVVEAGGGKRGFAAAGGVCRRRRGLSMLRGKEPPFDDCPPSVFVRSCFGGWVGLAHARWPTPSLGWHSAKPDWAVFATTGNRAR